MVGCICLHLPTPELPACGPVVSFQPGSGEQHTSSQSQSVVARDLLSVFWNEDGRAKGDALPATAILQSLWKDGRIPDTPAQGLELGTTEALGSLSCHRPHCPPEGWAHHLQLRREGEEECLAGTIEAFADSKSRGGEGPKCLESRRACRLQLDGSWRSSSNSTFRAW